MRHLDLFSGIGGFALAVEEIWPGAEHIFCDNDRYCRELLKLRFPKSKIYEDIKEIKIVADSDWNGLQKPREKQQTGRDRQLFENKAERIFKARYDSDSDSNGFAGGKKKINPAKAGKQALDESEGRVDLLTGGFPCQPFSQAGKRRGTDDDRYLWPEMLRVIRLVKPRWVIAENVRGLLTMQNGLVFEQVCSDLENSGYEVQPFIIPAVSVNAPHRRDRIWFVAHALGDKSDRKKKCRKLSKTREEQKQNGTTYGSARQSLRTAFGRRGERLKKDTFVAETARNTESAGQSGGDERPRKTQHGRTSSGSDKCLASDTESKRKGRRSGKKCGIEKRTMEPSKPERCEIRRESERCVGHITYAESRKPGKPSEPKRRKGFERRSWERSWLEVAAELCGVDDGLPAELDGFELTKSRHRVERLKALGNAIVPQVAMEIMRAIKTADENIGNA
ncbi:MAG TPA: DNA cytosine methyltransferase [Candidatus Moranbacteria bacterium]|nr:DNA cytosine methyltransferase [Candidatus Moranbacteria bacterium]